MLLSLCDSREKKAQEKQYFSDGRIWCYIFARNAKPTMFRKQKKKNPKTPWQSLCARVQLKRDGTRWRTGGEVKGKLANGVGSQYPSQYLGTHYRWCAHLGCQ